MKTFLLSSFGFKYGLPQDANYVFDVRFIPNPYYVTELKFLTGLDKQVRDYISSFEEAGLFLTSATLFLDAVIPKYLARRDSLHVAIGCTGGMHRSVAFVEWLGEHCGRTQADFIPEIRHRDVGRYINKEDKKAGK